MRSDSQPGRWAQMGADGVWTLLLSCLLILATLGISLLVMAWRVYRTARDTPTSATVHDWILVLGKRLLGATVTVEYASRLRRAELLYRATPTSRILVLGGHTSEGPFSEAQQGQNYLTMRGLPVAAVRLEDGSLHTLENLHNARQMLGDECNQPVVIITSRYHLARTQALALGLGMKHQLCAAEDRFQWSGSQAWRLCVEGFFLHWYWVGRCWSTWTGNRKSLARIS